MQETHSLNKIEDTIPGKHSKINLLDESGGVMTIEFPFSDQVQ